MSRKNIRIFTICIIASVLTIMKVSPVLAQLKIGYIRPQYIFSKFEPYKEAEKELRDYEKEEVDKLKKLETEYEKEVKDAEKQVVLMSEEMIGAKTQELNKRRENINTFYDELYKQPDGKLMKKQGELLQPIINRINEVLIRIGKEDGYDFILDAEGPVLYANEKYDISDYILEELQKDIPSR
ncbi:OmpH family outer membrane protein [Candidatus Omnitrophota bacterium]